MDFIQFIKAVRPTNENIAGIMRREDLCPIVVAKYNIYLSDRLQEDF